MGAIVSLSHGQDWDVYTSGRTAGAHTAAGAAGITVNPIAWMAASFAIAAILAASHAWAF